MPSTQKHTRNRSATTQRIVDALEELLADGGIDSVSISLLAQKADISKVLIYRYFGGLDGLLDYYLRLGRIVPQYSVALLEQMRPITPTDLAPIWSGQALQLFRRVRASRSARELLMATVKEHNPLADVVSQAQDAELTRMVGQLAFVEGADYQATSAVLLGALSHLTIQAQQNRPMIGIDLRTEAGWQRIEAAVSLIYKALGRLATESSTTQIATRPQGFEATSW